ncbi:MAG: GIY-YIG nuclease family protein [Armatimonadota bacterium]|nr:GIY-YIG nuclease family protein [Armatimonadota bacterium]
MKKLFYVYIMASRSRTLYVGMTSDLETRVYQHKHKLTPGFTSAYNINRLVHFEEAGDAASAIAREKEIKGWSRVKKVTLIEASNRVWDDLSEGWFEKADSSLRSE